MSAPLHDSVAAAVAELREQHERIRTAHDRLEQQSTTVTSKDRMITATVDSKQRLTALKLSGTRYRNLAPAELTTRIMEVVNSAQDESAGKSMAMIAELAPAEFGADLGAVFTGDLDLEGMFAEAIRTIRIPLFADDTELAAQKEARRDG